MTELVEMKTSDLEGEALNWAVAKAEGVAVQLVRGGRYGQPDSRWVVSGVGWVIDARFNWAADWALTGPLIDKYKMGFGVYSDAYFAVVGVNELSGAENGLTHLVAACRAIVFAKLGDTILIPTELVAP